MTQTPVYDLLIIGGGIAGAGIARDAALRGARVLLLEKKTFGSGTSSRSSRLIHGGIRYLEIAWSSLLSGNLGGAARNFRFVFSALRECRTLERTAPDLVKPISLLIPIYKTDPRRPGTVYAGAWLYWLLAALSGGGMKPKMHRGAEAARRVLPQLRAEGLLGAVEIWDRTTDDRELVRQTIESAQRAGAICLEQALVTGWERDESGSGFRVRSRIGVAETTFKTQTLVNASGPWLDRVRGISGAAASTPLISPVAGAHITVRPFLPVSALLQAKDKRIFFCINSHDGCRIGTTERDCDDPDQVRATEEEIKYLLESAAFYFPDQHLTRADIISTDAGIRPLARPAKAVSAHATSREHVITRDASGIVNVAGVKLTDYRRAAEDTIDFLLPDLLRHNPRILRRCTTAVTPL
ncbi:MAG: FAD-dependent oxidoreductase [Candidatus Omnitrophica bacterium]|jgi:glycerol-3-phosphate dehydrogenase|nr:FAD-dependent oxidoreductase [Candidatus Omnitrophota bacterium]